MAEYQSYESNTCVVCFKNVVYYSVGECDHPVCFECSTRMRVLCLQNECPICRKALEKVVFTETVKPYKELRTRVFKDHLFERQFKIQFCSEEIKKSYEFLLENRCKLCENQPPFRTFSMLSEHMRKVHERFFCDLCVKHLKIFTNERRCYTRQELAHHRRKGDLDDTSHRGHPLCEFCEQRFMDADELYRHLRKEHLYCHLCDADGRNLYYATHTALAQHFRTDHYLCEEGECANNHLTAVFRTEIDLKAHKATVHGRGMTRGASRQARTLELQFNIAPHPVLTTRMPRDRDRQGSPVRSSSPGEGGGGVGGVDGDVGSSSSVQIDTGSVEQFPRLSAAAPAPQPLLAAGKHNRNYSQGSDRLARTDRNFPTLGGGSGGGGGGSGGTAPSALSGAPASAVLRTSKPHVSIQLHSQPASASNFRLTQTSSHRPAPSTASTASTPRRPPPDDDFPSLGAPRDDHPALGAATLQPPKVTLINSQEMKAMKTNQSTSQSKRQPLSSDAFPALTSSAVPAAPAAPPQWITVSKDKGKPKSARTEPAPKPRPTPPAFNPVADFPTLPANKAKPKKVSVPPVPAPAKLVPPSPAPAKPAPAPAPSDTKTTKKERKKQNNNIKLQHQDLNSEPPTPTYLNGFTDKFTQRQLNEAYDAALGLNNNPTDTDRKIKTVGDNAPLERKKGGTGDFALASKDYPPLCKGAPPPEGPRLRTNGNVSAAGVLAAAAGGGGGGGNSGGRATCDGMTFTNSAGQEFSAVPHAYIPPPEFEKRNRQLARKLGGGGELAVASRAFRDGLISAEEFYAACEVALGPSLDTLLPELVALLPDINRQQELARGRVLPDLTVCKACGQLLAKNDALAHDQVHWPPLAN